MEDYEEVERYQKLLEDWKPGAATSQKVKPRPSVTSSTTYTSRPGLAHRAAPVAPHNVSNDVQYGAGAILLLNKRTLAIYKRFVPDKEYHLVLVLCPNNAVKIQGIALEGHDVEELGSISSGWLDRLQNDMTWERDLIVFHCYRYEDVARIPTMECYEEPAENIPSAPKDPLPEAVSPAPSAAKPEKPNANNLRRGQWLRIKFGSNTWDAVYWGKDDQGQVIAHQTYEHWSLMHLDLNRFLNGLEINPEIDTQLIQRIEQSLLNS